MDRFLARLDAFNGLPKTTVEDLSRRLVVKRFNKNEPVFEEGDRADAVHILRSGLLKGVKHAPRLEQTAMEIIGPGRMFGMIAVLDDKPYPVSVVALRESEAYRLPAKVFRSLMAEHPGFSKAVFAAVGGHVRRAQTLHALAGESVERRIAHILSLLRETLGERIDVRREEIAELAACTTPTAIRTLAAFKKKGWIAAGWKRLEIRDAKALRDLAGRS